MVDAICNFLVTKMKEQMPDIDEQRAEVINYGLQNLIGEFPKLALVVALAYILKVLDLTAISFASIFAYRAFSGGFHAKTHLVCILTTNLMYIGNVFLSKLLIYENINIKFVHIVFFRKFAH